MMRPIEMMAQSSHADISEVQDKAILLAAGFLVVAGGVASWLVLPIENFDPSHLAVGISMLGVGLAVLWLRGRWPLAARVALLVGPATAYALALVKLDQGYVPFFCVLIVILNAAVHPVAGFAAAALCSVAILTLIDARDVVIPVLLLVWLSAVAEWVSSRGLLVALDWVSSAQRRADQLVNQLRQNQGELNRTVAALTEATRRLQRSGHELAVARIHSDRLRDLKSRFAANISHELRTPLNLILGFSETMHLTPDVYGDMDWPPELRQDVRRIYQSSTQLAGLINDVLDLSRIDGGEMPVHKTTTDLETVIMDAVSLIRDLLRGRDLVLEASISPKIPPLDIDSARIRQVLVNLLNNASRFTQQGSIRVSAETVADHVIVSVADTGVGIAPDEIAKVFDEYHQVDMSLRTAKDGAGLGLAISKRFVELHGGRIWVESDMGIGSTFYFSLPLKAQESARGRLITTSPPVLQQPDGHRLVVVDEDPAVGELLERYLGDYQIEQASSIREGKAAAIASQACGIVINTFPDPELQKVAARNAMAALPSHLPVLVCAIPSRGWTAQLAGANHCLEKPIVRQEIDRVLAEYAGAANIMVVDDDPGFVQLITRYLQNADTKLDIRSAYDGVQALELIHAMPPDLLFLDLVMPRMDGAELLATMRNDTALAKIPVVVMTATDFGKEALANRPRTVQIHRSAGLGAQETIAYLKSILGTTVAS